MHFKTFQHFYVPLACVIYLHVAGHCLWCNSIINQFSHAVEESFANLLWQINGNQDLASNTGMNFTRFWLSINCMGVFAATHRCVSAQTTAQLRAYTQVRICRTKRTSTEPCGLIYIQIKMSIFFNLKPRWWLLIPVYCARSKSFCLRLIWCFVAIWCVSAWMCFLMCECVVMCLGYQVWNGRQSPVLACRHTQRGALMAQKPAHSFSLPFSFTFFAAKHNNL